MITFCPDKFGFYQVGNRSTYSKLEAFEWMQAEKTTAEWNFNRSVFDSLEWTKEPETDLWTMYKLRARQIREAYDYVVLFYSGGSDSHNILHAWLDAGLKIDEIATTWNYEATGDKQNHYNAEITNVVLPDIKTLKDAGHEFKFRLIDISQFCIDLFDVWVNEFDYNVNFHFSPNNPAKHLFRDKIQDYKNLIASGKKVCFVWGKEKPNLRYGDGSHYFEFCDNIDNAVGPYVQRKYHQGWYDELFYWTPDFPLIPVKQSHVILNYIEHAPESDFAERTKPSQIHNAYSKKYNKYLKEEVLKTIIYPKWSNDIFCNGKTSSFTYSIRDEWFLTSNLEIKRKFIYLTNYYFAKVDPNNTQSRRNIRPYYTTYKVK